MAASKRLNLLVYFFYKRIILFIFFNILAWYQIGPFLGKIIGDFFVTLRIFFFENSRIDIYLGYGKA